MQRVAANKQDRDETWLTFYRVDCECGQAMEVKTSWAGTMINCAECQREFEVASLSGFKELPAIMRPQPIVSRIMQFGLKPLFFCLSHSR